MRRRFQGLSVGLAVACATLAGAAAAGDPDYLSAKGGFSVILDEPCPANELPPFNIGFFSPEFDLDGGSESVQCVATARNEGEVVRRGVQVRLEGEILDLNGDPIRDLPGRARNLNPYGRFSWPYSAGFGGALVGLEGSVSGTGQIDQLQVDCRGQSRVPCVRGPETACLFGNGRFEVEVDFDAGFGPEAAQVLRVAGLTADFYFFDPTNAELQVQLLNRCTFNDHFWVFAAATTDVEYTLKVTDTQSGATRSYGNPLGLQAPAITDTAAFATCP